MSMLAKNAAGRARAGAAIALLAFTTGAPADEVTVAVAANFIGPMREIAAMFEAATGHTVNVSSGSTGQLFAQVSNGAPFDVLLAADRERPALLAERGYADPSSAFTYAVGRLALWTRDRNRVIGRSVDEALREDFRWFAIAEPQVAPYGAAARQVLQSVGAWESIQSRLVRAQNIAQTFAMVETGNAELGLVALSQAIAYEQPASYFEIPQQLYDPIRQDAILLGRGAGNEAAHAFMQFLRSEDAAQVVEAFGYAVLPAESSAAASVDQAAELSRQAP